MEAPAAELYVNALLHYLGDWIGARILPVCPAAERPPLILGVADHHADIVLAALDTLGLISVKGLPHLLAEVVEG